MLTRCGSRSVPVHKRSWLCSLCMNQWNAIKHRELIGPAWPPAFKWWIELAEIHLLLLIVAISVPCKIAGTISRAIMVIQITVGQDDLNMVGLIWEARRVMFQPVSINASQYLTDHLGEHAQCVTIYFSLQIGMQPYT